MWIVGVNLFWFLLDSYFLLFFQVDVVQRLTEC